MTKRRNRNVDEVTSALKKLTAEGFFAYVDKHTAVINADVHRKPGFDEAGYWKSLAALKKKNPRGYKLSYDIPEQYQDSSDGEG